MNVTRTKEIADMNLEAQRYRFSMSLSTAPNFVSLNLVSRDRLRNLNMVAAAPGNPHFGLSVQRPGRQGGHAQVKAFNGSEGPSVSAQSEGSRPSRGEFMAAFMANYGC
jgi:hypothetical protein